eukprot:CAMPEP_0181216884 /NCGR_PEP_ID=MMETSP1096-20121128/26839_1 /TAXON_ID=156174 ORGANISM="Chrysochromulina ericina, Strain CCMP281" /NCGR_SAMPLE_ID=MMETSP1096 /ASSEMBLY_ACC=CAM_ASM_000453 /LENGTH=213 /DNA_ID=CAMNT_0023308945 /DNA_START=220 /DNA_END=859 /DNA_ORIENTATION=-
MYPDDRGSGERGGAYFTVGDAVRHCGYSRPYLDKDTRHVVAPSFGALASREAVVEEATAERSRCRSGVPRPLTTHDLNGLLIREHIPHAITRQQQQPSRLKANLAALWHRGHHLLLGWQLSSLEPQVADGGEKSSSPLILPALSTEPSGESASRIRRFSARTVGLWSVEIASAVAPARTEATALQSPALATHTHGSTSFAGIHNGTNGRRSHL